MNMWCDGCGRLGNEEDMLVVGDECVMDDCNGTIHVDLKWLDRNDLEGLDEFDLLRVANDIRIQYGEAIGGAASPPAKITRVAQLHAASREAAAKITALVVEDPFPPNGVCVECNGESFAVVETGYERSTQIDLEFADDDDDPDGEPSQIYTQAFGLTNGWSDFSDDGDIETCACTECGHIYELPGVFEWN